MFVCNWKLATSKNFTFRAKGNSSCGWWAIGYILLGTIYFCWKRILPFFFTGLLQSRGLLMKNREIVSIGRENKAFFLSYKDSPFPFPCQSQRWADTSPEFGCFFRYASRDVSCPLNLIDYILLDWTGKSRTRFCRYVIYLNVEILRERGTSIPCQHIWSSGVKHALPRILEVITGSRTGWWCPLQKCLLVPINKSQPLGNFLCLNLCCTYAFMSSLSFLHKCTSESQQWPIVPSRLDFFVVFNACKVSTSQDSHDQGQEQRKYLDCETP